MDVVDQAAIAVVYFICINLITYGAFWLDKRRARKRQWRISEGRLLSLALIGGSLGAKRAQKRFRHKTRKQPFASTLNVIVVLHIVVVVGGGVVLVVPDIRERANALVNHVVNPAEPGAIPRPVMPRRFGPGAQDGPKFLSVDPD